MLFLSLLNLFTKNIFLNLIKTTFIWSYNLIKNNEQNNFTAMLKSILCYLNCYRVILQLPLTFFLIDSDNQ